MDRSVSKYLSSSIKIDILSTTIKISIQQIGGTGQIKYNELDFSHSMNIIKNKK